MRSRALLIATLWSLVGWFAASCNSGTNPTLNYQEQVQQETAEPTEPGFQPAPGTPPEGGFHENTVAPQTHQNPD